MGETHKEGTTAAREKIGESALRLKELLQDTPYDVSVYRYFNDTYCKAIIKLLDQSFIDQSDFDNKMGRIDIKEFAGSILPAPRMSEILDLLAVYAMQVNNSQEFYGEKFFEPYLVGWPLLSKPGEETAARDYFILSISKHLEGAIRKPLHEVVAAITRIVIDRSVTGETVRGAVNRNKRRAVKTRKISLK
ncbi:MAG: hypothetical protein IPK65_01250 [Gammaproteobacteria bacterium]|nr:hypothetical protein [Gammaproteobacteria bacterium]